MKTRNIIFLIFFALPSLLLANLCQIISPTVFEQNCVGSENICHCMNQVKDKFPFLEGRMLSAEDKKRTIELSCLKGNWEREKSELFELYVKNIFAVESSGVLNPKQFQEQIKGCSIDRLIHNITSTACFNSENLKQETSRFAESLKATYTMLSSPVSLPMSEQNCLSFKDFHNATLFNKTYTSSSLASDSALLNILQKDTTNKEFLEQLTRNGQTDILLALQENPISLANGLKAYCSSRIEKSKNDLCDPKVSTCNTSKELSVFVLPKLRLKSQTLTAGSFDKKDIISETIETSLVTHEHCTMKRVDDPRRGERDLATFENKLQSMKENYASFNQKICPQLLNCKEKKNCEKRESFLSWWEVNCHNAQQFSTESLDEYGEVTLNKKNQLCSDVQLLQMYEYKKDLVARGLEDINEQPLRTLNDNLSISFKEIITDQKKPMVVVSESSHPKIISRIDAKKTESRYQEERGKKSAISTDKLSHNDTASSEYYPEDIAARSNEFASWMNKAAIASSKINSSNIAPKVNPLPATVSAQMPNSPSRNNDIARSFNELDEKVETSVTPTHIPPTYAPKNRTAESMRQPSGTFIPKNSSVSNSITSGTQQSISPYEDTGSPLLASVKSNTQAMNNATLKNSPGKEVTSKLNASEITEYRLEKIEDLEKVILTKDFKLPTLVKKFSYLNYKITLTKENGVIQSVEVQPLNKDILNQVVSVLRQNNVLLRSTTVSKLDAELEL